MESCKNCELRKCSLLFADCEEANMADENDVQDRQVEMWKIRKLIKSLDAARGSTGGTSMITLNLPPRDQISKTSKMLTEEYGAAACIKSRVNLKRPSCRHNRSSSFSLECLEMA